jgi:hypothetical protein
LFCALLAKVLKRPKTLSAKTGVSKKRLKRGYPSQASKLILQTFAKSLSKSSFWALFLKSAKVNPSWFCGLLLKVHV